MANTVSKTARQLGRLIITHYIPISKQMMNTLYVGERINPENQSMEEYPMARPAQRGSSKIILPLNFGDHSLCTSTSRDEDKEKERTEKTCSHVSV